MWTKWIDAWYWIRSGFWFIPSVMASATFLLAWICLSFDKTTKDGFHESLFGVYIGGPEGARQLLSTVAGSMITVAGVIFSITIVALSQVSAQFGPRILRNFMRDTANQIVLGVFISTFLYCLLILRTVRAEAEGNPAFVPQLSITVSVVLALTSLGFLIFFIHHVSGSLQIDDVIAKISKGMDAKKNGEYFRDVGRPSESAVSGYPARPSGGPDLEVKTSKSGYIQSIDAAGCMAYACRLDLTMELMFRPGDFAIKGATLARVWANGKALPGLEIKVNRFFTLGIHRTPTQDLRYRINQLVEVALRALSPSMSDPMTALMCLDRLGEFLVGLSKCDPPTPFRLDEKGRLRLIDHPPQFPELVGLVMDPIRTYGKGDPTIVRKALHILTGMAQASLKREFLEPLISHARLLTMEGGESTPWDKHTLDSVHWAFLDAKDKAMSRLAAES